MKQESNLFKIFFMLGLMIFSSCKSIDLQATPMDTENVHPTSKIILESTEIPNSSGDLDKEIKDHDIDEFFENSYRKLLERDPEAIVEMGLEHQFQDLQPQLTNISENYLNENQEIIKSILNELRSFDRDNLSYQQQISYDVYESYLQDLVTGDHFRYYDYPVTFFITGVQVELIQFFTDIHPLDSKTDAEAYISRLNQVDEKFDGLLEGLRSREQAGIIPPKFVIQWSLGNIREIALGPARQTPFFNAFEEKLNQLSSIDNVEKQVLLQSAEGSIEQSVMPAYQALAEYLEELQKKAPTHDGVWQHLEGDTYYQYTLRHHTTTDLSADEIHQLGLEEVKRIQEEMHTIFNSLGYPTNEKLPQLFERVAADSGFVSPNQMGESYTDIIHQAENNLSSVFDITPQAKVIVIAGPIGNYYVPASLDGSRPGAFYANTTQGSPRFAMPTLAYHEAVPGHHLQIALAQETDLPSFRNSISFTAYAEGWALYAEQLAEELGWYEDDPYGDLGRLQAEAFRASRLVVDTGLHTKKWTFDEAENYMVENTGLQRNMVRGEIGRYIAWPGQATAYKIGMLKILALRQQAEQQLEEDFNLKEFHNLILGIGSMPLDLLEQVVEDYINAKLSK